MAGRALPAHVPPAAVAYGRACSAGDQSPIVATFMDKNLGTLRPIGDEYTAFLEAQEASYRLAAPSPGTN